MEQQEQLRQEEEREEAVSLKLSRSSKRWMAFWTFFAIICLLGGAAGGVLLYVADALAPVEPAGQEVRFTIPKGVSSGRIARILEENGIIKDGTVFHYYLKYKNEGSHFQAGEYAMKPGITVHEIIRMLNNGETVEPETIRFTLAEGLTVEQMAERLAELGAADKQEFLDLAANPDKLAAKDGMNIPPFVSQIPDSEAYKYRLEGYLFPETYEMKAESTANEIVLRLLQETANKLRQLPEGWEEQMSKLGVSFHELMTIASLIEREVVLDEERPIVAGIIYNRLARKMNLEIDATVQYALPEHKERLLEKDLEVDSPYNTYRNPGLPPGPIASPGLASIRAALYPEETKYLFYVTKKDGSNAHLFAETFRQHQRNIAESSRMAKESGSGG